MLPAANRFTASCTLKTIPTFETRSARRAFRKLRDKRAQADPLVHQLRWKLEVYTILAETEQQSYPSGGISRSRLYVSPSSIAEIVRYVELCFSLSLSRARENTASSTIICGSSARIRFFRRDPRYVNTNRAGNGPIIGARLLNHRRRTRRLLPNNVTTRARIIATAAKTGANERAMHVIDIITRESFDPRGKLRRLRQVRIDRRSENTFGP